MAYQIVTPLAISHCVPNTIGTLGCFSLHNRVINLITAHQELITLHCHFRDLSPMGYILKKQDFVYFQHLFETDQRISIIQQPFGIQINDIIIINSVRKLSLNVTAKCISSFSFIDNVRTQYNNQTGLFGALNLIDKKNLPALLDELKKQILLLLNNQDCDLSSMIGLGPGLTPTGDDIIIGILLMINADPLSRHRLAHLSSQLNLSSLKQQTTVISAHFLNHASRGIFSTTLLSVLHLIKSKNDKNLTAITRLMSYGHTSGADILLGIWLGALILEKYKYG